LQDWTLTDGFIAGYNMSSNVGPTGINETYTTVMHADQRGLYVFEILIEI